MIPRPKEHPLKKKVRANGLRLYQLRELCGGSPSESQLSRMLSGVQPMKPQIEARIRQVVKRLSE